MQRVWRSSRKSPFLVPDTLVAQADILTKSLSINPVSCGSCAYAFRSIAVFHRRSVCGADLFASFRPSAGHRSGSEVRLTASYPHAV